LTKLLKGTAMIDPEFERFVNQVHRDDIACALYLLIDSRSTGGEIYNVVDDQPTLQSECYRWLAQRLSRPVPSIGASPHSRKRGDSNKRVSNAKLREIGWSPRFPTFADAMEKSILPSFADLIRDVSC
jgi:nucleoside-diphosphate-sugar epimerase